MIKASLETDVIKEVISSLVKSESSDLVKKMLE